MPGGFPDDDAAVGPLATLASAAVGAVSDGVVLVDASGGVLHVNAAAERLCGWKLHEVIGRPVCDIVVLHTDRGQGVLPDLLQGALGGEAPSQGTTWLQPRAGERCRVRHGVHGVTDADGQVVGAVVVLTDLSEGQRLNELLARADRLSSMGLMAATIAHEINNPLTYMLLNVEALIDQASGSDALDPSMLDPLRDIGMGARAIERIVHDLKLLTTPGLRSRQAVAVAPVLRRTQRMAAKAVRARGRFEASLPHTQPVLANAVALGQVVTNLVLNAAQALPEEYSETSVVRLSCEDRLDEVWIEVSDNGRGIEDTVLDRIFDPFFTTSDIGRGTGLGLAICHQIVADLGGHIEVESEVGVGTTMRVVLPTTSVHPADLAAENSLLENGSWPPRRVLIIDDDASVRRALSSSLRRVHTVETAGSVDDAVACLRRGVGYDAILCDLMMSPRNGLEILDELTRLAPDLIDRTAFITGGVFHGAMHEKVLRSGRPVAYKPFRGPELLRLVESMAQG